MLTDDDELARVLSSLRNQGRSDDGAWLVHSRLGFNYRLSDVHCAIGVAQLERLDEMMAGRERVAGWYQERVREMDGVTPMYEGAQRRSWFVYAPRLDPDLARDEIIGDLDAAGVSAKPYLPCIHLQPYYREAHGHGPGELPVTEAISASTIALPFFPEMTEAQVDRVCAALGAAIAARRARRAGGGRGMTDGARLWGGRFAAGPAGPSTASTRRWRSTAGSGRTTSPPRGPTPACSRPRGSSRARTPTPSRRGSTASRTSCGRATSPSASPTRTSTPPSSAG